MGVWLSACSHFFINHIHKSLTTQKDKLYDKNIFIISKLWI